MSWGETIVGGAVGGGVVTVVADILREVRLRRAEAQARQRATDVAALRNLRATISQSDYEFIRDFDFGGSWRTADVGGIHRYSQVMREPESTTSMSRSIEALRCVLVDAIERWERALDQYSILDGSLSRPLHWEERDVLSNTSGAQQWVAEQAVLNQTSKGVAQAYKPLMDAVRREFPEVFLIGAREALGDPPGA